MKFTNAFVAWAFALITLHTPVASANANANAQLQARNALDVFVPPILDPHNGTVWVVGQTRSVIWDVRNPPQQITNPIGRIMLVKGGLITNITLASCFNILIGSIDVTVPNVTGNDINVVLFGDSGNFSPTFSIVP